MEVYRAARLGEPGLSARLVQYADECLAFKDRIKDHDDGVEAALLLVYLTIVSEARYEADAAQWEVYDHVHSSAMVFLADFDIDSLHFLELQGLVARRTSDGTPPWSLLDEFSGEVPDCFPPYD
ncbi:hypothetical protein [Streptomyces sp. NPDC051109]|uniref:hypothetical protein n=1 Tax=Streptomyces sp. NPDC051109 TaxID=3365642 RepID=UPI0037B9CE21